MATEQRRESATTPRRRKAAPVSGPDEEQVRVLAYEIYQTRHAKGTSGDAVTDWLDAERMLREKPAATRPRRSASRS